MRGSTSLALRASVTPLVVGLTVVALGTSSPELLVSLQAALVHPLTSQGIGLIDLGVMAAVALLVLPLMRSGFRLSRWEGILLLSIYSGYVFYLFTLVS